MWGTFIPASSQSLTSLRISPSALLIKSPEQNFADRCEILNPDERNHYYDQTLCIVSMT